MVKYSTRIIEILGVLALLFLCFPQKVYAYLDPGTWSYILQLSIGALFGVLLASKVFWRRIKNFFGILFSRRQKDKQKNKK